MNGTLNNRASVTLALGLEMALELSSLTKLQLAAKADCSPGHITDIENCTKNPSQALVSRLAEALGRTPAELYELGELELDRQTLARAQRIRERVERLRNCQVVLEALRDFGARDLQAVISAASILLESPVE